MNDLMSQQQRHLLNSMGVDVWILKETQPKSFVATQFWRDQAYEKFDLNEPVIEPLPTLQNIVVEKPHLQSKHDIQILNEEIIGLTKDQHQTRSLEVTSVHEVTSEIALQILPFTLALLTIDQCSILLNYTELLAQEKIFVESLRSALGATITELRWPINLADFQQSDYVNSYVNGFIDSTSLGQRIILLGGLPKVLDLDIAIKTVGITDLINNPKEKRVLWEMLKAINSPNY
ncbi:hypothetical protein SAMN05421733_102221 [Acinetobacter boissieri]|uniref:Uncharacterized protein n=2 Tax=Acinetobacter boissieri TaxID=1219383 RepID=A0A1G6GTY4_9GAMM|nr:hypothetical protein SAMN05421733_102221 [Acinetobacter boissieri]